MEEHPKEKSIGKTVIMIGLVAGFIIFFLGLAFKLQHWPGAGAMLLGSMLFIATLHSIRFLLEKTKKWPDVFTLITAYLWVGNG